MFERIKSTLTREKGQPDGGTVMVNQNDSLSGSLYQRMGLQKEESLAGEGNGTRPGEPPVGFDQVFDILKNQRRRDVLRVVGAVDGQVRLGELAEQIAAWENEKDIKQITSQERKRVYVGLYQCHLPKMDDVDVVSFNKPRGTIETGEHMAFVEQFLPAEDHATTLEIDHEQ